MRKRLSQADRRRRTVTKKAHSERKTRASKRTKPVLSKGHPQDVAHPATAKQAESDSETELYSVASLSETARSQLLLTESVTQGREQTGSDQGRDPDGSRRRVGLEPTPTREQTELGRRSPHIYRAERTNGQLGAVHKVCHPIAFTNFNPLPCHKLLQISDPLPLK